MEFIQVSALYDKMKTTLKFLFTLVFIITLASCGTTSDEWPGADTGVVTKNPDVMPDIRWQTPDQRKVLSERLEQAQKQAEDARKTPTDYSNPLSSTNDIQWKDEVSSTQPQEDVKADNEDYKNDPLYDELYGDKPVQKTATPSYERTSKIKVHLLVPLSGDKANLGKSMLNAAQMALFDVGSENFELVPVDTKGERYGAKQAVEKAIQDKSSLILGPVFAQNLEVVKPIAESAHIPVVSFTNDWKMADKNTYIMGFMPFTQVTRIVKYAERQGYNKFAAYAPQTEYSDVVVKTMGRVLQDSPSTFNDIGRYAAQQRDVSNLVNDFIETHKVKPEEPALPIDALVDENGNPIVEGAEKLGSTAKLEAELSAADEKKKAEEEAKNFTLTFDALMLPLGGESLKTIINQLEINNVDQQKVKYIGTGLWDDDKMTNFPSMYGAWFAAPDPKMREDFEHNYKDNFGETPVRIASLAYDATALAAVLARRPTEDGETPYTRANMTNPRGFAGIDGIFRFRDDGLSERGLAILEIRPGAMKVIDRAPTAFMPTADKY